MVDADPKRRLPSASPSGLAEHFFRHESGRLTANLVRRFGAGRLSAIEDATQSALAAAVTHWPRHGIPENPSAWLTRAATNRLIDDLRRAHQRDTSLGDDDTYPGQAQGETPGYSQEIFDDELRMLFVCCDPQLKPRMQLVLACKLLCGFSTREIAARLFTSEANVQKLLDRGRSCLRESSSSRDFDWDSENRHVIVERTPSVLEIIYLLFNEGYSSMQSDRVIRQELCREALRLGEIVARHPVAGCPEADALMALMLFHFARLDSRLDETGGLLLLEEQDRSRWDTQLMHQGAQFLFKSGQGDAISRYHAQAAIVAEHCMARTFEETDFEEIASLYEALERLEPSPLHTLNRAIAVMEWKGPEAALELFDSVKPPAWLTGYYLWEGTRGEILRRLGRFEEAARHLENARSAAPTDPEQRVFERRLRWARAKKRGTHQSAANVAQRIKSLTSSGK